MDYQTYVNVFKALSHRSRLQLLELLARHGERAVSELAEAVPREESTVSRHLNLLLLHGLVKVRQEGQNRYYSLNFERLAEVLEGFLNELRTARAQTQRK